MAQGATAHSEHGAVQGQLAALHGDGDVSTAGQLLRAVGQVIQAQCRACRQGGAWPLPMPLLLCLLLAVCLLLALQACALQDRHISLSGVGLHSNEL